MRNIPNTLSGASQPPVLAAATLKTIRSLKASAHHRKIYILIMLLLDSSTMGSVLAMLIVIQGPLKFPPSIRAC